MFPQIGKPKEQVSERAFNARQNNVLQMLESLAANKQAEVEERPAEPMAPPKGMAPPQESAGQKPMQAPQGQDADLLQLQQELRAAAFDEEGNFKAPPVKGYWRMMLERINENDPYKRGRDWRDEAIEKFREAEAALDEAEASSHGRV